MFLFTKIFHIILCFLLILIILLQPGKDSSDVFGGGQSGNQRYAARSASNPLTKATTLVAVLFMFTSISLAWYSSESAQSDSQVVDDIKRYEQEAIKKENLVFELPKLRNINKSLLLSTPPNEMENQENSTQTLNAEQLQQLQQLVEEGSSETPNNDSNRNQEEDTLEKIAEPVE